MSRRRSKKRDGGENERVALHRKKESERSCNHDEGPFEKGLGIPTWDVPIGVVIVSFFNERVPVPAQTDAENKIQMMLGVVY